MSTESKDTKKIEPKFNEEQAYFELCQIFAIAIQTQNFDNIEAQIASWKSKYPLDDFLSLDILAKIKRILSREYLEHLLGKYLAAKITSDRQKQEKAFTELKQIIADSKREKDFVKAQKDIAKWRKSHSLYSFDRVYRARVCRLISKEYIASITETERRDKAFLEFQEIKSHAESYNSKELNSKIEDWMKTYPVENFHLDFNKEISALTAESLELTTKKLTEETAIAEVNLFLEEAKHSSEPTSIDAVSSILSKYDTNKFGDTANKQIASLTYELLQFTSSLPTPDNENQNAIKNVDSSVTTDDKDLDSIPVTLSDVRQRNAFSEFKDIIDVDPHNTAEILNWVYKYRKITFSGFSKEQLLTEFLSAGYTIPKKANYSFEKREDKTEKISFNDYSNIDKIRKNTVSNYFGVMLYNQNMTAPIKDGIENAYAMSSQAQAIENINSEIEDDELFQSFTPVLEEKQEEIEAEEKSFL